VVVAAALLVVVKGGSFGEGGSFDEGRSTDEGIPRGRWLKVERNAGSPRGLTPILE
jgi:hypothetical protein